MSNVLSAKEKRMAESHARLRQLGARHQLASGFPDEGLADAACPITPADEAREETLRPPAFAEEVDFDDGISAISSHTLEEMERRRAAKEKVGRSSKNRSVMRPNTLNFAPVHEEECGPDPGGWCRQRDGGLAQVDEEVGAEVVFGEPFYKEETTQEDQGTLPTAVSDKVVADGLHKTTEFDRVGSNRTNVTMNTTASDDSGEFQELLNRNEAIYWTDEDHVNTVERKSRGLTNMGIEERVRRLREVSRSRSRSDGTGSTLASGSHPHDTIPLYSSDVFRKSSSGSAGSRGGGPPRHTQSRLGILTQRGASGALDAAVKNAEDRARALLNLGHGEI